MVTIADGNRGIEFGPIDWSTSADPYDGDSFPCRLFADGLTASRRVFMFRHDWPRLVAFFGDLADSWRGFAGERVYRTVESDLEIRATADSRGVVRLTGLIQDGPTLMWTARVAELEIAAGEDTAAPARNVERWATVP